MVMCHISFPYALHQLYPADPYYKTIPEYWLQLLKYIWFTNALLFYDFWSKCLNLNSTSRPHYKAK